jgi:F-type H+-transporting ATPase subunit epsilon
MASTVHCSIVSAELEIFSGMVEMVVASGTEGELGIFPGHTPLLSGVKPGPVRLRLEGGAEEIFFASGGYIEVQPTAITILADTAIRADDIDEAAALEAKAKAERDLADNRADIDFGRISVDLAEQAAMLRTLRKHRERWMLTAQ